MRLDVLDVVLAAQTLLGVAVQKLSTTAGMSYDARNRKIAIAYRDDERLAVVRQEGREAQNTVLDLVVL